MDLQSRSPTLQWSRVFEEHNKTESTSLHAVVVLCPFMVLIWEGCFERIRRTRNCSSSQVELQRIFDPPVIFMASTA